MIMVSFVLNLDKETHEHDSVSVLLFYCFAFEAGSLCSPGCPWARSSPASVAQEEKWEPGTTTPAPAASQFEIHVFPH